MLTVCCYGEFDPFSGSIGRRHEYLDDVARVLAMLCLLYDVVIVPPGALLEHPLGLPAFERLAPFVREGLLGTTASPSEPGPRIYMKERLRSRADGRLDRRRGSLKSSDVIDLQARLSDILPARWTITRDVARQVSGCANHIRRFCETTAGTMAAATKLLALMHATSQERGTPLVRDELLGRLAVLRGDVAPHELSIMAIAPRPPWSGRACSGSGSSAPADTACSSPSPRERAPRSRSRMPIPPLSPSRASPDAPPLRP
ncbi:hypothetical protein WME94_38175 [Sorangium sp. So ce429]